MLQIYPKMSFKTGCVNVYVTTFSREPTYDSTRRGMTQGRIKNTHIWESKRWIPAKFEPDSPEMTSLKMSMLAESGRVGVDRTGGSGSVLRGGVRRRRERPEKGEGKTETAEMENVNKLISAKMLLLS